MVATNVPTAAIRITTTTAIGKMKSVVIPRRFRLPYRFGLSGQVTASLRVAIGTCVIGQPQATSDNSRDDELCIAAKTLFFTIVVMATSIQGSTLYNVAIPESM